MTQSQLNFANVWMGILNNDKEAILHQLSIKKDFNIPNFNLEESMEIWDFIRCKFEQEES